MLGMSLFWEEGYDTKVTKDHGVHGNNVSLTSLHCIELVDVLP